jgi:hypothetical protein
LQQSAAKKRAIWIQIFRLYPLAGMKVHFSFCWFHARILINKKIKCLAKILEDFAVPDGRAAETFSKPHALSHPEGSGNKAVQADQRQAFRQMDSPSKKIKALTISAKASKQAAVVIKRMIT